VLIVDLRAEHVGGQQVGGELNPLKGRADRLGERTHGQRLGESGNAFEQHVTAGQQADEQAVDHVLLADDTPRGLARHLVHEASVSRRGRLGGLSCLSCLTCVSCLGCHAYAPGGLGYWPLRPS
jgi:hypothetical protein